MAKFAKSDIVRANRIPIPRDTYTVRILKADKAQSEKGFEMTKASMEIISPETIEYKGESVSIAGYKATCNFLHNPSEDWGQARVVEFCEKIGLSEEAQEDTDVFRQELVGKVLEWVLDSEEMIERYGRNDPNEAKRNKPILDGEGKEISKGFRVQAGLNGQECIRAVD